MRLHRRPRRPHRMMDYVCRDVCRVPESFVNPYAPRFRQSPPLSSCYPTPNPPSPLVPFLPLSAWVGNDKIRSMMAEDIFSPSPVLHPSPSPPPDPSQILPSELSTTSQSCRPRKLENSFQNHAAFLEPLLHPPQLPPAEESEVLFLITESVRSCYRLPPSFISLHFMPSLFAGFFSGLKDGLTS
ncbi:hypothetical protein CEXT_353121 [Caerostris extrusa]|uniref:Uncharacterized protein n=1 Tax=Caerostris extrusa TaxID=172846 RepID=A0AAV4Q109_CAEEX|nr:hypothetical protein CEXT_353121 [Caerostris extrusa]